MCSKSLQTPADCCKDRILATIYGQAVGDAIGLLTEFLNKRVAKIYFKKVEKHLELEHKDLCQDIHRNRWKTGDWTDDTDQMILILQSLIDQGGKVKDTDFGAKLKKWSSEGFRELGDHGGIGIGRTTRAVLSHPQYLTTPATAAFEVWENSGKNIAPNGGVMRTSIVGVHKYWDTDEVANNARVFCTATHYDPRCQASAVAVSVAISLMLKRDAKYLKKNKKYNIKAIIEDSFQSASQCLDTSEEKDELKKYMFCDKLKILKLDESGKIGYTYKCMGSGFWALKQDDFRKAMQKLVMEGGDADTNGAVAGALLGCKLGMAGLPESWVGKLMHKDWLDIKIDKYLIILDKLMRGESIETETAECNEQSDVVTDYNME